MRTYKQDWEPVLEQVASSASPLIRYLRTFWDEPLRAESDYFTLLGHLARNGAGAAAAKHAITVAASRLSDAGVRNASVAIEVHGECCLQALRVLRGPERDRADESLRTLVFGREALEGLRTLLLLVQLESTEVAQRSAFAELLRESVAAPGQIDLEVERSGLLRGTTLSTHPVGSGQHEYVAPLAVLHPDDWWHALRTLASVRQSGIPPRVSDKFVDDFPSLRDWVRELRSVQWDHVDEVRSVGKQLQRLIDASYRPRQLKDRAVARVLRILWDAASKQLKMLRARGTRGELAHALAGTVTLTMTLYDRVRGQVDAAARIPNDLQRLGWALHAWRSARMLQSQDGEVLINAFRRHEFWQGSGTDDLDHPEAVAAGCVAVAWYLGQTGYQAEGCEWLARADALVQGSHQSDEQRRRHLIRIAEGYTELASLLLESSENADESIRLVGRAIALADVCSNTAARVEADRILLVRVRAMSIRASACDQKEQFPLAMDERHAALRQLEDAPVGREIAHAVMELRRDLYLAVGNVDAADRLMVDFIRSARGDSAEAVAFNRATMLLDYGYEEAGIEALEQMLRGRKRSEWASRARALLQRVSPPSLDDDDDLWQLERAAQTAANEARAAAKTTAKGSVLDRAIALNEKVLRKRRDDLFALTRKVQLLILRGEEKDLERAQIILDRLRPDDPYVLFYQGQLAYRRNEYLAAISWLREAYEVAPRAHTAALLANSFIHTHQLNAAVEAIDAHDSVDDDAPLLDIKGAALASMGEHVRAWGSLQQACMALASARNVASPAEPNDGIPRRTTAVCRRLASVAANVAKSDRSLVARFLRSDVKAAPLFVRACISRLAFEPELQDVIFNAADVPAVQKSIAQYAMGACIYEDTMGRSEDIARIIKRAWDALDLQHDRYLIAELLAGGKSSYRASIRSALDGDMTKTHVNSARWLLADASQRSDIAQHVATTRRSNSYYQDTSRLVDRHPELWSSLDALIEHVRNQIPYVRRSNFEQLELTPVIEVLSSAVGTEAQTALFEAALKTGAEPVIVSAHELGLSKAPGCLLDVTPCTISLVCASFGAPSAYTIIDNEDTNAGLVIRFGSTSWPTSARALLERERLLAGDDSSMIVPIEAMAETRAGN